MTKELCECGKIAVWCYIPGYSRGGNPYHCDDCVPRGCECNYNYSDVNAYHPPLDEQNLPEGIQDVDWKWIDVDKIWTYIDDKGREYPCAEYDWEPDGYEREINPHL